MKKILIALIAVGMCLTLAACASTTKEVKENTNANLPNPMVEFKSLEEINDKIGCGLVKPPVMGVSEEKFFVISDTLADYHFTLNGYDYNFRASKDLSNDISGVHVTGGTMFKGEADGTEYYSESPYKGFRFVVDNTQYTLVVQDGGELDNETFVNITNEIYDLVCQELSCAEVNALIGEYQDSTSQRAMAKVSVIDKDRLFINITWSNSAKSYEEWIIDAKYEDGKLNYGMGEIDHLAIDTLEDGTSDVKQANDAIPGYFEVIDGKICWTGSGIESTAECVFEKLQ